MIFRTILCAVPAFMRDDPARTSGPTSVTMAKPASSHLVPSQLGIIFKGFRGSSKGFRTPRNHELHRAPSHMKSRNALRGVKCGDAAAGARADIDEAPAFAERGRN